MELAQQIALCHTYRLSQRTIAQRLGVAESTVSNWFNKRQPMPAARQAALWAILQELQSSPLAHDQAPVCEQALAALDHFMQYLTIEHPTSPHTQASYRATILAWLRQFPTIEGLTPHNVRRFLSEQDISARSRAQKQAALRAFAKFLKSERLLSVNPLADLQTPRLPRALPHVLTQQQVEKLLQQPSRHTPTGLRDLAMLELTYGSGLRVSELVSLTLQDVHMMEGWLKVRFAKGNKERLLPMGEPSIEALQTYLHNARPLLCNHASTKALFVNWRGQRMIRQGFWKLVRSYARQAGISAPLSPHTLRPSFATHLLEGGADILSISLLLGHSDITTTEVYTHVSPTHLRKAYERYFPRQWARLTPGKGADQGLQETVTRQ